MFFKKENRIADKTHEALVAAFCLVSFADGELHTAELSRFIRLLEREYPGMAPDGERLVHDVITLGRELVKDFGRGKTKALKIIAQVKNDGAAVDRIMKLGQIAIISDNRIQQAEEDTFNEIAAALGRG